MTSKSTNSFSKEELESHGIWVESMVNPSTFHPYVRIFNRNDIMWSASKEFSGDYTSQDISKFINETVYKIIYKNRRKKINKIISKV